jgi:hypothetical protein
MDARRMPKQAIDRSLLHADCDLTAALLGAGWEGRAMRELRETQSLVVRGWFTLLSEDARAGAQTPPDLPASLVKRAARFRVALSALIRSPIRLECYGQSGTACSARRVRLLGSNRVAP